MTRAARLAEAADALVGCRFRLHGRDPATGLDCVGVLAAALAKTGCAAAVPGDYGFRMRDIGFVAPLATRFGLAVADGPPLAGDVLLFRVGPAQHHFAIVAGADGMLIHAHAGLGRVVRSPALAGWTVAGHWRLAADRQEMFR